VLPGSDPAALQSAFEVIRQGRLVAFPTDTVYGLAVDAFCAECIQLLFEVKDRDMAKAIPVLVGDPAQLAQVAVAVSPAALCLAQHFWPGPLTLVVPRHPSLPEVLSPLPNVGVRMPDHPLALALLRRTGPLATTSANLSGAANPLTAQDVYHQLNGRIDLILDGGTTPGGVPSTVVDCTTPTPTILRQGPITLEMINSVLKDDK
jgi:L-threonylcarbamoyladenylate synthase